MMKGVKKIDIEGIPTYVKRDSLGKGYRIIHPYKNEDGTWNWFNLCTGGSWWNLWLIVFIVALIAFGSWAYKRDIRVCLETLEKCNSQVDFSVIGNQNLGLKNGSEFNFTAAVEKLKESENGTDG